MPSQPHACDLLPISTLLDQLRKDLRGDIQQDLDKIALKLVDEIQTRMSKDVVNAAMIGLERQESPEQDTGDCFAGCSERVMPMSPPEQYERGSSSMHLEVDMHLKPSKSFRHYIDEDACRQEQSLQNWLRQMTLKTREKAFLDMTEESGAASGLARIVQSKYFTSLSLFVILANAVWMGYDCEETLQTFEDTDSWSSKVSLTFSVFYAAEVILKLIALRKYFLFGVDWRWNLLELSLVLLSIPEYLQAVGTFNILRLLRLIKLTRVLRLMRFIRFITSLREILLSFVDTLGCLFWSFVAFILVLYMQAVFFMQAISLLIEQGDAPPDEILEEFGSTASSMLTLFSVISGGQDWFYVAQSFKTNSWLGALSRYAFVFYIYFMMFGFLSVIIAVFCSKVEEAKCDDEDLMVAKEESKYMSIIQKVIDVFRAMGLKSNEHITRHDFTEYVKSSKSLALRGMPGFHGVQFFSLDKLWHILTLSSGTTDGTVDFAGFVLAILRLSGEGSATELVLLSSDLEHLDTRLENDLTRLEHSLKQLSEFKGAFNANRVRRL